MVKIFLAFHDAAGRTSHVVLPQSSPYATTHLPDTCTDGLDLSVFRNDTHSIVRIRTFEDYVLLSALPNTHGSVCIQTSPGVQVIVPSSTTSDTTWYILEDGAQFTYAAVRCSVEFDYDHSISNSMRPPPQPQSSKEPSAFDDSVMLPDKKNAEDSDTQSGSSVYEDPGPSGVVDDQYEKAVTRTSDPEISETNAPPTTAPAIRSAGEESQIIPEPSSHAMQPPSNILQPLPTNIRRTVQRRAGEESQTLARSKAAITNSRKAGDESQVLQANKVTRRMSGQESQQLPVQSVGPLGQTKTAEKALHTIKTIATPLSDGENISGLTQRQDTSSIHANRTSANLEDTTHKLEVHTPSMPISDRGSTAVLTSTPFKRRKPLLHDVSDEDVATPVNKRKPLLLDVSDEDVAAPIKRTRFSMSSPDPLGMQSQPVTNSTAISKHTDGFSASDTIVVKVPPRNKVKRPRSLRSVNDQVTSPVNSTVVFGSGCKIQNKKKTMDSFAQLGGKITEDIDDASILCVAASDDLKRTPKFILAVIKGKVVVTETWIVDCSRRGKLLDPGPYLPQASKQEQEWKFNLSEALVRGRNPNGEVSQLFKDYKLYLTQQLRDQLSKKSNLQAFIKIATAMCSGPVRLRLPTKFGSKMIVLGVDEDYDAAAVGKLGFPLYNKDLLTMSALRGRRQDDTDEFKIDIPIKEEELSQN